MKPVKKKKCFCSLEQKVLKSPDGGVWICSGDSFREDVWEVIGVSNTQTPGGRPAVFESVFIAPAGGGMVVFVLWAVFQSKRPRRPDHYDFPSKRSDYL